MVSLRRGPRRLLLVAKARLGGLGHGPRGPIPRKKFSQLALRHVGNAGEHVSESGLRIDIVEFGRDNEGVHERGSASTAVRTGEEPRFSAKGNSAQRTLGCVVREADAAILKECGKASPAREHIVHGLGHRSVTRELFALGHHIGMQLIDEWRA